MPMLSNTETAREARARRVLARDGYSLRKSRAKVTHLHDHGGYRIVNTLRNTIEAGETFDLSLGDVERFGAG